MKQHCFVITLLLLLVCPLLNAAVSVSTDRRSVQINESFQLIFNADQAPEKTPDFSPLQPYFTILDTSQNSKISIINGDYQRSIQWTLQLMPKQVGDIIVPSIDFGNDKTKPLQISVKPAAPTSAVVGNGLMVELSADRQSVSVQGQVIVTLRLLSDSNITNYEFGELVVGNMDVIIEPLGEVKRFQTRSGNKAYLVLERQYALFPQSSGVMVIEPVLGQVRLSSASRSIFDPFQSRGEIRSAYSEQLTLEVTGIQPAFNGQHWLPAHNLRLNEVWQDGSDRLVAGEPITRTITLVAGGLTSAQLPKIEQAAVAGVRQYPDQAVLNDRQNEQGIVGVQQQKIALIPTAAGTYRLPDISIPWWNTQTGKQQVARIPARTIQVAAAPITSRTMVTEPPASTNTPTAAAPEVVLQTNRFWVGLSLFLACGWLISLLIGWWWHRRHNPQPDTPAKTSAQTPLKRRQASQKLRQACVGNDAADARDALLAWAQTLPVETTFTHLQQLANYFGEPLKSQINAMNQSLYGGHTLAWQGRELWQTCQSIADNSQTKKSVEVGGLLALNP